MPANELLQSFSAEQIAQLRDALVAHEQQNSQNVFDLSKPPKTPYTYQEFPKLVYGHEGEKKGHVLKVHNQAEEEAALAAGYKSEPHPEHDYSRIDRNGMIAAKHESAPEATTEDQLAAAQAHQAKEVEAEKKKNRRS